MEIGIKSGTVVSVRQAGYPQEVAEILGHIDWLFEKLIELGVIEGDVAEELGNRTAAAMKRSH